MTISPATIDRDAFYNQEQVKRLLGISIKAIGNACRTGELRSTETWPTPGRAGRTRIYEPSFSRYSSGQGLNLGIVFSIPCEPPGKRSSNANSPCMSFVAGLGTRKPSLRKAISWSPIKTSKTHAKKAARNPARAAPKVARNPAR